MGYLESLFCLDCRSSYDYKLSLHACVKCGGVLSASYRYESIAEVLSREELTKRPPGVWKYAELLPLNNISEIVSLGEGGTFLHRSERLSNEIGLTRLWVKDETTNPTGSFIDRGSTVLVSKARGEGFSRIRCPTTGNLGASISAYSAKAGIECSIFIPGTFDLGKLYQVMVYGAHIQMCRDYKDAHLKASTDLHMGLTVTSEDPYLLEGEKTTGYEICEQLDWRTPDVIILPMGSGGHISMIWKALSEFKRCGLIDHVKCRLIGVQIEGASPIVDAFQRGTSVSSTELKRFHPALDLGIDQPRLGDMAIRSLKESRGYAASVDYSEVIEATRLLAKTEGIFAEPAAASTLAGLRSLLQEGYIKRDDEVVCVVTGAGLKDPTAVRRALENKMLKRILYNVEDRMLVGGLGQTKLQILDILAEDEGYGYEIAKKLRERFGKVVKLPSVYQHLGELQTFRFISAGRRRSTRGRRERQYYAITDLGRSALKSLRTIVTLES